MPSTSTSPGTAMSRSFTHSLLSIVSLHVRARFARCGYSFSDERIGDVGQCVPSPGAECNICCCLICICDRELSCEVRILVAECHPLEVERERIRIGDGVPCDEVPILAECGRGTIRSLEHIN